MELFTSGIAVGVIGLVVALVGAVVSGTAMTHKPPKGAPPGGGLYVDFDKAGRGLWLIAGGTALQIVGALQAAYRLL